MLHIIAGNNFHGDYRLVIRAADGAAWLAETI